tara:strand:+ start:27467 stop:29635 length:2169 start_codon:yes stop_codon:yes gene_type:complete
MATETVDGISFSVDMDTSGAIKSIDVIDNQNKKIIKSFKGLDTQTTKTAKGVKNGLSGIGRGAGQAGIQLQQFIGQVQGGQSAMLALSQQSADLGFVLGAPLLGAVAGISASIAGILLPSLLNSKTGAQKLEEALEALKKIVTETDGGVLVLSESIEKLAKKSEAAAKVELALGIVKAKEALKAAREEVDDSVESWESFIAVNETIDNAVTGLKNLEKAAKQSGKSQFETLMELGNTYKGTILEIANLRDVVEGLSDDFGISEKQALKFVQAIGKFKEGKDAKSIQQLAVVVSDLAVNIDKPNKKLIEMAKRINTASVSATNSQEVIDLLKESLGDFDEALEKGTESSKKRSDALDSLSSSLTSQIIALEQGEEAAFRYATAQQLGLKVGEQIPANIDEQISAIFRLKQAQEDAAAQKRKDAADERKLSSLGSSTANLGLTDEEQIRERLARDLELLNQAQEAKIESEKSYEDRRVELRRQAEERIRGINEKSTQDSILNYEALENQAIGTFASVVSGAQDGKQAVRSLAQSVVTQMIGALIKMGIQAAIGQTTAAATGAATAASLSAAYATPAALASLASFGANAVPAAAGIASTVGLAQGLSLAGGREHGGPVAAGSLYEVGEKNKPEMLMIPGNNGKVFSNAEMKNAMSGGGSGETSLNVVVNTLPGQTASVTQQGEGVDRQTVIQIIAEQSAQVGSTMNRNFNKNHNTTDRLGANRRN